LLLALTTMSMFNAGEFFPHVWSAPQTVDRLQVGN
jgi:hypothetical protein